LTFAVEALPWPRPDRHCSVNSILEAKRGAVAGEIDRRLRQGTGLDEDRIGRTGRTLDTGVS
jgi:hypothetical protein